MIIKNKSTVASFEKSASKRGVLPDASQENESLQDQLVFLKRQNKQLVQKNQLLTAQLKTQRNASSLAELKFRELEAVVNERNRADKRYRQLFDIAPIGYLSVDESGIIQHVNLAATCLLKSPSSHLIKTSFCNFLSDSDQIRLLSHLKTSCTSRISHNWEVTLVPSNGPEIEVMLVTSTIKQMAAGSQTFQIMIVDMSQRANTERLLRNANDYLVKLAQHDPLTKLPNRTMFADQLQTRIIEKSETQGKLGIIYFDLDGFKPVNDTFGHQAGDQVLIEVANRVKNSLGPNDFVARLGGDEFTVILDNPESAEAAMGTAQELAYIIGQPINLNDTEVGVTSSMGISLYPDHARSTDNLIKGADAAMYQAKNTGKNQVCLLSQKTLESTDRVAILETGLAHPQFRQQLQLHYQPIYNTNSLTVQSVEALIRWNHPDLGQILPVEFIPLAEKSNHILEVGKWVIEKACWQSRQWRNDGLDVVIAINVSAYQLFETDFAEFVELCLKKHGLKASALEIEITESAIMIDHTRCRETLQLLIEKGHTITIDDFGTGYSALARLAQLPVSRLKIDRMFIKDMDDSEQVKSVVTSIINMAHELGLQVISEGIEKTSQFEAVKDMKSDFVQGYMMSMPKRASELPADFHFDSACITVQGP